MDNNRKGQLGLEGLLTGFVIIAAVLFLIVLLIFTFGILDTSLDSTKDAQSVSNDTSAAINATGYRLASGITGEPRDFVITQARNGTSGLVIASPNYTVSSGGLLTNATARVWPVVHVDYTYNNNSVEQVATESAQSSTVRVVPFMGILFIIIAIGAVITIFTLSMLGRRRA